MSSLKNKLYFRRGVIRDMPWVTYTCLAICALVFLLELPYLNTYSNPIVVNFGVQGNMVFKYNQYYRLITAGFIHLSWMHILMNGYSLYIMGPRLEALLGHGKYAALLFCSIIGGNLMVSYLAPFTIAVGMSTGLYGLMAYDIAILAKEYGWDAVWNDSGIRWTILVNLFMNFTPGISWQGHLGGAIVGIVFAATEGVARRV